MASLRAAAACLRCEGGTAYLPALAARLLCRCRRFAEAGTVFARLGGLVLGGGGGEGEGEGALPPLGAPPLPLPPTQSSKRSRGCLLQGAGAFASARMFKEQVPCQPLTSPP